MHDSPVAQVIRSKARDLGGFSVRRILPSLGRKMVGPFVFFDHMGPAEFPPGKGMDVRPHPHIGLATVTYLFEGAIQHRDSLGSNQVIRPGDINWMTAGAGIVHSERTPFAERAGGGRIEGLQIWIALPREAEEVAPSFIHHPAHSLPRFQVGEVSLLLLLGQAFGHASPVRTYSDALYLDAVLPSSSRLEMEAGAREIAIYHLSGDLAIGGIASEAGTLSILQKTTRLELFAASDARCIIFGGEPLAEPREIWWNFVSSRKERIEEARLAWKEGRFPHVPGDEAEFIPLPEI